MLLLRAIKFCVYFACTLRLAFDACSVLAIFVFCVCILCLARIGVCAFDEILFRLGKLIGDDRGGEYQLAIVCDFYPALKFQKEVLKKKK